MITTATPPGPVTRHSANGRSPSSQREIADAVAPAATSSAALASMSLV